MLGGQIARGEGRGAEEEGALMTQPRMPSLQALRLAAKEQSRGSPRWAKGCAPWV